MKRLLPNSLLIKEPGLQVIRLGGSPVEMGLAHGRMLADDIKHLRREFLRYLAQLSFGIGALPLYFTICFFAARFKQFIPAPIWEELKAVAAGAGVHVSFILFINVMDDLLNNIPRCSTFAASLANSQPHNFILGRNLDYPLFAEVMCRFNTIFVLFPQTGQPLVSVAWPGYVGVCTGMNFSKVALGQLTASTSDFSMAGVPSALRNRLALQHCLSPVEVAARITSLPGTIGANIILASPLEALLLEVSAHHRRVRVPTEGFLTATNHYQSPAMQDFKGAEFRRPPLSPLDPFCFSRDYSLMRNERLQELLKTGNLDVIRAQQILADSVIANPCDVNSVVFDTAASELYVAQGLDTPVSQRGRFRHLADIFGPRPRLN
jgi:Acyl-coenzyme A:6-aminopenicillanic acid acyl-transferase